MIILLLAVVFAACAFGVWVHHLDATKQIIGDDQGTPYMVRYFISRPNTKKKGRIYLHKFLRSDHDRALHDHPWNFVSIILKGGYWEFADDRAIPYKQKAGNERKYGSTYGQPEDKAYTMHIEREKFSSRAFPLTAYHDSLVKPDKYIPASVKGQSFRWFGPGSILRRGAGWRHRVALPAGNTAWTIIYTTPKLREWGFWPNDKFCHWTKYDSYLGICNTPEDITSKLTLYIEPEVQGYDWEDIKREMNPAHFSNFEDFMRGQTLVVLNGKSIVNAQDLYRFLKGLPVLD